MAQGFDLKSLGSGKSPPNELKSGDFAKKTRGVGSRRIFSPQFKLQVLDSYRNDVDCKGNQRATARKYNIHRRQIQKWLQCEQNLRISVEENAKNENPGSSSAKLSKKIIAEGKINLTLNQSATAFTRLGHADNLVDETTSLQLENKTHAPQESSVEVQNLKRVAQKLYPSLPNNSCVREEKVVSGANIENQKYVAHNDVACTFGIFPGSVNKIDSNFNKIIFKDNNSPLNLKSKVYSDVLPGELSATIVDDVLPNDKLNKLKIGVVNNCQSGLISSSENIGGPKLCVSNAVLQCPVQKYNMDDIDGQKLCNQNPENNELLCSQPENRVESSCLLNIFVPKNFGSVPRSPDSSAKRKFKTNEESASEVPELKLPNEEYSSNLCSKKPKLGASFYSKSINDFECSKSFSPKRKWIKESMQEMLEDSNLHQENLSLPIKQRVKMNLRSMPESTQKAEDCRKSNVGSSNFTIEKLCSSNSSCEKENSSFCEWRSFCHLNTSPSLNYSPSPSYNPSLIFPDGITLNISSDQNSEPIAKSPNSADYSFHLPLKEERISDSEDADIDIMSTTPVEKKSFDFSSYNLGKRRSFSVQFKLTVLDAFYNDKDCNKNQRATARKFNINRRQVQKWLSQESDLRSESSVKSGKYLQRQRLGSETRDGDAVCTKCPQHCRSKNEELVSFDETIQVNVKHCSDNECFSRRHKFDLNSSNSRLASEVEIFNKALFSSDLKTTNYYRNYLFPENSSMPYHDSIFGWPSFNSSALTVPNFQFLSTWHHNNDYCHEHQKIY